jgi:hypothetical protein
MQIHCVKLLFLLSTFFSFNSLDAATEVKRPVEDQYQELLTDGDYNNLIPFLQNMLDRLKDRLITVQRIESDLKEEALADEIELETASETVNIVRMALQLWQRRFDAVSSLKNTAEEEKRYIQQVSSILPRVMELTQTTIDRKHRSNATYAELARYIKEHGNVLQTIDEIKDTIPTITFELAVTQVIQEGRILKFQKAVEAYLIRLKQETEIKAAKRKEIATNISRNSDSQSDTWEKDDTTTSNIDLTESLKLNPRKKAAASKPIVSFLPQVESKKTIPQANIYFGSKINAKILLQIQREIRNISIAKAINKTLAKRERAAAVAKKFGISTTTLYIYVTQDGDFTDKGNSIVQAAN